MLMNVGAFLLNTVLAILSRLFIALLFTSDQSAFLQPIITSGC